MATNYTERFSEGFQAEAGLAPDARAAAVYNTPWVSMQNFQRAVAILRTGEMAATVTLDCVMQEAQDNAGTGAVAIAGKAITQLTQAGGDGNDTVMIELQSEELQVASGATGFDHVRLQITVANAAVDFDAFILRFCFGHPPVSVAALTEVVD